MVLGQLSLNPSSKHNTNPNTNPNQEPIYSGAIVWTPSVLINQGELFILHLKYIMLYVVYAAYAVYCAVVQYYSVLLLSHE